MTKWIFIHPLMTFFLALFAIWAISDFLSGLTRIGKTENHYHTHNHYSCPEDCEEEQEEEEEEEED